MIGPAWNPACLEKQILLFSTPAVKFSKFDLLLTVFFLCDSE